MLRLHHGGNWSPEFDGVTCVSKVEPVRRVKRCDNEGAPELLRGIAPHASTAGLEPPRLTANAVPELSPKSVSTAGADAIACTPAPTV